MHVKRGALIITQENKEKLLTFKRKPYVRNQYEEYKKHSSRKVL